MKPKKVGAKKTAAKKGAGKKAAAKKATRSATRGPVAVEATSDDGGDDIDDVDPGSPMQLPARVQDWVDAVVDEALGGAGADQGAYARLRAWLQDEWERISEGSGPGQLAFDASGREGEITDDQVRDDLGLEEDDEISMEDRRVCLADWLSAKLEDADESPSFATLELTARDARTARLGYSISGYSFTEVEAEFHGVYPSESDFHDDVLTEEWITSEEVVAEAPDAWVMAFFEKPRAPRRRKPKAP